MKHIKYITNHNEIMQKIDKLLDDMQKMKSLKLISKNKLSLDV